MADFTIVKGMVDGQSISQWTQDWWTWALQAPYATNPLLDATGAFAGVDNNNSVSLLRAPLPILADLQPSSERSMFLLENRCLSAFSTLSILSF
jgi:hypothetical protein